MNKYSELSDPDVDLTVADILYPQGSKFDLFFREYIMSQIESGDISYCNSWADAGPIIYSSGISVAFDEVTGYWDAWKKMDTFTSQNQTNPLRAAMEVFLMIKDAKGE